MKYRQLGKTGMNVSCIGLGTGAISALDTKEAIPMIQRALALGVNYIDTARIYGVAEVSFGAALKGQREKVYISSKTVGKTKEEAWKQLHESLERLQTDYLDNYHLHDIRNEADLEARIAPGGPLEALIEAREQGLIRHIGCTSHTNCGVLIKALERFDFETILVPLNIVKRDALDELIPLCGEKGVGVTVMKPLATGMLPAQISLKWLLNQQVATVVPGSSTVANVEENSLIGAMEDTTLTADEEKQVDLWTRRLEHVRCRICMECEPCPVGIPIWNVLGTFGIYEKYRNLGPEGFAAKRWAAEVVEENRENLPELIKKIEACNDCGLCVERCRYALPIPELMRERVPGIRDMLRIWDEGAY